MTEQAAETTVVETVAVQTEAVTTPANVEPAGGDELGKVRELVLRAHPDVVPDLVRGASVDELIASVEPARSAYQRIAEQVRGTESRSRAVEESRSERVFPTSDSGLPTHDSVSQPPVVPAGGAGNVAEPTDLTPTTKIAQALAERSRKS